MKRLGISFSIIILILLVLLGSGRFTISKMMCGGNECTSTYTLGKGKDCCITANSTANILSTSCCCELIDVSYSLDEFNISEKVTVYAQESNIFISPFVVLFHLPSFFVHFSFTDLSPPDTKELLHLFCSLLL